jgi:hypothetical protein
MAESGLLEKLEGLQHKFDEISTLITIRRLYQIRNDM